MKLVKYVAACLIIVMVFPSCYRLSKKERDVVGSWSFRTLEGVVKTKFKRDHKVETVMYSPDQIVRFTGLWRLEGNTLIQEVEAPSASNGEEPLREVKRELIREISQDKIVTDVVTYSRE